LLAFTLPVVVPSASISGSVRRYDSRPSEVSPIFALIARDEGIFDDEFTEEEFLRKVSD
jgi:hypothetical protein